MSQQACHAKQSCCMLFFCCCCRHRPHCHDIGSTQVMRFLRSRCITRAKKGRLVAALRERLSAVSANGKVSDEDEEALKGLEKVRWVGCAYT